MVFPILYWNEGSVNQSLQHVGSPGELLTPSHPEGSRQNRE